MLSGRAGPNPAKRSPRNPWQIVGGGLLRPLVLVTGGAGFIGSHVVDLLVERGYRVRVYDNLVKQVHGDAGPRYVHEDAEFVRGDMLDEETLRQALVGVNVIVHDAAEVGVGQSMYEIRRYVGANTGGTAVLLELLANEAHSVERIVVASSMSIYGEGAYLCDEHGRRVARVAWRAAVGEQGLGGHVSPVWRPRRSCRDARVQAVAANLDLRDLENGSGVDVSGGGRRLRDRRRCSSLLQHVWGAAVALQSVYRGGGDLQFASPQRQAAARVRGRAAASRLRPCE